MEDNELMGRMKVSKAVAKMAIPSVISSLVTVVYNMADTLLCGTDGRRSSGGGGESHQSHIYSDDGLCKHVWNGRKRGGFHGSGRAE